MRFKTWMVEIRVPYLYLPIVLTAVGSILAFYDGHFSLLPCLVFTAVLVLLHISVNTLNDYYDDRTKIDHNTNRTAFNGGTGILQEGLLRPGEVMRTALLCFVIAALLSAYLVITVSWSLLLIVIPGMLFALFYTQFFVRNMLGEIAAGLGLGGLPVLGAYLVQIQAIPLPLVLLAVSSSLLTFDLLLLNEFPDESADRLGGRRNLILRFGKRRSAWIYGVNTLMVYAILLGGIVLGMFPALTVVGLLTLPLAYKAVSGAFKGDEPLGHFFNAQRANIQVVLLTQVLFVIGFAAAMII
ncbi:MAG: 1,4-dihydroxy-2-naphthoate octaprenyltransferase [Methanomassiliicoccales archaeon PtaU1.Bin124]|nr:MAG: 1,4-dihydroxy-2-naphthoate octaprenyltransferase [Methanomassiliicoccales archaeon PtaU1.Bin124]